MFYLFFKVRVTHFGLRDFATSFSFHSGDPTRSNFAQILLYVGRLTSFLSIPFFHFDTDPDPVKTGSKSTQLACPPFNFSFNFGPDHGNWTRIYLACFLKIYFFVSHLYTVPRLPFHSDVDPDLHCLLIRNLLFFLVISTQTSVSF